MSEIEQSYDLEELYNDNEHLASSTLYHIFGNPLELARSKGIDFEDLLQVARMGLWNACLTYDEDKSQFQTHAINQIKWTVFPAITNDFNVFKYAANRIPDPEEQYSIGSFDAPVGTEDGSSDLHEFVSDNGAETVEDQAMFDILIESFSDKLSDRQKKILKLRYDGWMNADIAEELGVSRQAVGQALRAIRKTVGDKESLLQ